MSEDETKRYLWRVPSRSSSELRESDYSAYVWERAGMKPTILFPLQKGVDTTDGDD